MSRGTSEENPIYLTIDQVYALEERFGFSAEYEMLKEGKTIFKDGKYYKLSPMSGASTLR